MASRRRRALGPLLWAAGLVAAVALSGPAGLGGDGPRHQVGLGSASTSAVGTRSGVLHYRGGPVQRRPAVYLSYWGREWADGFGAGTRTGDQVRGYLEAFFIGVEGSPWIASTDQYCQAVPAGSTSCAGAPPGARVTSSAGRLRGSWIDVTQVPDTPGDSDVEAAARRAATHFGRQSDATYFVFTPPHRALAGFSKTYCAYHGETSVSSTPVAFAYVPYQPDAGGFCGEYLVNQDEDSFGHGYLDGYSINAGHEYAEAIVNPESDSAPGWIDASGLESADKCQPGPGGGTARNVTLGGGYFAVQALWSNAAGGGAGGCVFGS
jgi:hypothetical protein